MREINFMMQAISVRKHNVIAMQANMKGAKVPFKKLTKEKVILDPVKEEIIQRAIEKQKQRKARKGK
jgi:hypothetical protein